jgi:putative flippase GtrA
MDGLESLRLPQGTIAGVSKVRILIQEALGYTAASAFTLIVDIAILWTLVHRFSWPYLAAAAASFSVGLLVAYALSVTTVFRYRRLKNQPLELASFVAVGVVGPAINAVAMFFGVRYLRVHYLAAKCGAAGLTLVWNFAVRRQLLFFQRRAAS